MRTQVSLKKPLAIAEIVFSAVDIPTQQMQHRFENNGEHTTDVYK